jgi:hypothetical protein
MECCKYTDGVGPGKEHELPVEKYDSEQGDYESNVGAPEEHLPTSALPKGTNPSPFKLGPKTPSQG